MEEKRGTTTDKDCTFKTTMDGDCSTRKYGVRTVMLSIYSMVVVCVGILSVQSLDGSQVEGWLLEWMHGGDSLEGYGNERQDHVAATALCRCGGNVTLVVDYIGYGVGMPEKVDDGLLQVLERGRRSGQGQVCMKNLVTSFVHRSVENLEDLLYVNVHNRRVSLDMEGAYTIGWKVHDEMVVEYPGDVDSRGMVMHLILMDVSRKLHGDDTIGFPMLGVLSESDAIAIVDARDVASLTSLVHEVDAWLYGKGLVESLKEGPESIARACRVDATMNLKRLSNVIHHGRQIRASPGLSAAIRDTLQSSGEEHTSMEARFEQSRSIYHLLHSPDFGIEPRMPVMHVVALLMPFGMPLVFALMQSLKFLWKKQGTTSPSQQQGPKVKEM